MRERSRASDQHFPFPGLHITLPTDEDPTGDARAWVYTPWASDGDGSKDDLMTRAINATKWRATGSVCRALVGLSVGVLLARLLPPEDFGLLAMAAIFTGFVQLLSTTGLSASVIQRRNLTRGAVRTAFTLALSMGLLAAGLTYVLAPVAAEILDAPDLVSVLRVLSIGFVLGGLGSVASSLMQRALDFKAFFFIGLTAQLLGYASVGITLALLGFGVWSLVFAMLAQHTMGTLLRYGRVRHPVLPGIQKNEARGLITFGAGFSGTTVITFFAHRGDDLLIGRQLGDAALGLYDRAYGLMRVSEDLLGNLISSVLFPAFSEIQGDQDRLRAAFLGAKRGTASLALPLMAGMTVAAPELVPVVYGDDWTPSVLPLQLLAVPGAFHTLYWLTTIALQSDGRAIPVLRLSVAYPVLIVSLTFVGLNWGLPGASAGVSIAILLAYGTMVTYACRAWSITLYELLRELAPGVALASIVAFTALAVRLGGLALGLDPAPVLGVTFTACAASLFIGMRLLRSHMVPSRLAKALAKQFQGLPKVIRPFFMGLIPKPKDSEEA